MFNHIQCWAFLPTLPFEFICSSVPATGFHFIPLHEIKEVPSVPSIFFLWRLLNTVILHMPCFLIDKFERWCSKCLKTNHFLLTQIFCGDFLNFTQYFNVAPKTWIFKWQELFQYCLATVYMPHRHINRQNFSPISHSHLHKQVLQHSSLPPEACSQLLPRRTLSALHDSLLPPKHLFFLCKLIYTGLLLKQAKQFRSFCVKCLLLYLIFCHSLCYVEIKQQWIR